MLSNLFDELEMSNELTIQSISYPLCILIILYQLGVFSAHEAAFYATVQFTMSRFFGLRDGDASILDTSTLNIPGRFPDLQTPSFGPISPPSLPTRLARIIRKALASPPPAPIFSAPPQQFCAPVKPSLLSTWAAEIAAERGEPRPTYQPPYPLKRFASSQPLVWHRPLPATYYAELSRRSRPVQDQPTQPNAARKTEEDEQAWRRFLATFSIYRRTTQQRVGPTAALYSSSAALRVLRDTRAEASLAPTAIRQPVSAPAPAVRFSAPTNPASAPVAASNSASRDIEMSDAASAPKPAPTTAPPAPALAPEPAAPLPAPTNPASAPVAASSSTAPPPPAPTPSEPAPIPATLKYSQLGPATTWKTNYLLNTPSLRTLAAQKAMATLWLTTWSQNLADAALWQPAYNPSTPIANWREKAIDLDWLDSIAEASAQCTYLLDWVGETKTSLDSKLSEQEIADMNIVALVRRVSSRFAEANIALPGADDEVMVAKGCLADAKGVFKKAIKRFPDRGSS